MAEVLIIGSGGREAALEQAMLASEEVNRVVVTENLNEGLGQLSKVEKPFVVIGPEQPLVDGMADELRWGGYTVFGAGKRAARYEASKAFSSLMMSNFGIPHPTSYVTQEWHDATRFMNEHLPSSYVIKADGIVRGTGAITPKTHSEALDSVADMMEGRLFGDAGKRVNFAERHSGPEVSVMVVVGDNDEFFILPTAQDHKRLGEGDTGPNTGGMGAYAPVPKEILSDEQYGQIYESVEKSLHSMRTYGTPVERGLLYPGFMLSEQHNGRPVILEYNVRFGDPETQAILPLARKAGIDVYRLLRSAAEGSLEIPDVDLSKFTASAITVCLAAEGYPKNPVKDAQVWGLENQYPAVDVQLAGVKDGLVSGGRVLYVTGVESSLQKAAKAAYNAIDLDHEGPDSGKIGFAGMQVRRDIGHQALA